MCEAPWSYTYKSCRYVDKIYHKDLFFKIKKLSKYTLLLKKIIYLINESFSGLLYLKEKCNLWKRYDFLISSQQIKIKAMGFLCH